SLGYFGKLPVESQLISRVEFYFALINFGNCPITIVFHLKNPILVIKRALSYFCQHRFYIMWHSLCRYLRGFGFLGGLFGLSWLSLLRYIFLLQPFFYRSYFTYDVFTVQCPIYCIFIFHFYT